MTSNEQNNQPESTGRRRFLQNIAGVAAVAAVGTASAAAASSRPRLGVVTNATGKGGPVAGIAKVHALGFPTCQVHVGMSPPGIVEPLREALAKYQVEATAVMTLGEGKSWVHGRRINGSSSRLSAR